MSVSTLDTRLSHIPSVGLSVTPESVLWQNSWLNPDAILGGEWGRSSDECVGWCLDCWRGMGSFGSKCGTFHCNQWDSLCEGWRCTLPKWLWGGLVFNMLWYYCVVKAFLSLLFMFRFNSLVEVCRIVSSCCTILLFCFVWYYLGELAPER